MERWSIQIRCGVERIDISNHINSRPVGLDIFQIAIIITSTIDSQLKRYIDRYSAGYHATRVRWTARSEVAVSTRQALDIHRTHSSRCANVTITLKTLLIKFKIIVITCIRRIPTHAGPVESSRSFIRVSHFDIGVVDISKGVRAYLYGSCVRAQPWRQHSVDVESET